MNRRRFLAAAAAGMAVAAGAADPDGKLRVAVIGHTGRGNYGHGLDTMWQHLAATEVVAVADADEKGLAAAQKRLHVAKGFSDYRRMLTETRPDIVAICPRHLTEHCEMALAAIEAGVRGIFLEKPFCRTPAEADAIVEACARRQVKLAVAHRNRYHPVLPVVDRLLQDGTVGRVLEIRCRGKEDQRGGAQDLWDLGTHVLNLAHHLAGKPLACAGVLLQDGRPATHEDLHEAAEGEGPVAGNELHARFEMERGLPVFFDSLRGAGSREAGFGLQVVCAQGLLDLRCDKQPFAQLLSGNPFLPGDKPRAWVPVSTAGLGQPEPRSELAAEFQAQQWCGADLIAAIRENRPPLCSAEDGRVTVEMVAAVFESHRLGGRRVTLPLPTRQNPLTLL